jgi:serine/threonine protein phosphatase PrpC
VTRGIGDRDLRSLGLSSEPEIVAIPRGEGDLGVILASDGLWDVLTEERALHCLRHTARSADMLAKRLVFDAMDKGTDDNVTCAVVLL